VVGVIVVGPRRENDIGLPLANRADHLQPHFEGGHQLAIVVIHDLVFGDAEPAGRFLGLDVPAPGQCDAAHFLVAGVSVGDRNEFHRGPGLDEFRGRAAEFAVAIVRVGPESDHPERSLLRHEYPNRHKTCDP
jgi:hypothetical protein